MPSGNHCLKIGLWGAPFAAPANTMAAFRAAFANHCDWVLCAARPCADGTVVLSEEDTLRDRSGRAWSVARSDVADLALLDLGNGDGIATLIELVAWAAGRVGVIAAVAPDSEPRALLDVVEALCPLPRARKMACASDPDTAARLRALCPDLPLLLHVPDVTLAVWEDGPPVPHVQAVAVEASGLTAKRIERLHAGDCRVFAWAADDWETAHATLEAGADALITRRPEAIPDL